MIKDLTVVVIAFNEEENLEHLLSKLRGEVGEVVVIDNNSTDETARVARRWGATLMQTKIVNFAQVRNLALEKVKTKWVFYLDADERVTKDGWQEMGAVLEEGVAAAVAIRRRNFCYGYELKHGGWEKDVVVRVFERSNFKGWTGEIHESPQFTGEVKQLVTPLLHLTHRNTVENLAKSSRWTIKEAQLLVEAGVGKVNKYVILRKMVMEFYRRYVRDRGYKDGMAGFVESLTQAMNRAFVYMQVWELQQKPSLKKRYEKIETQV
jgi:glycosyltransferase involved in cell wall biosynthesis